MAKSKKLLVQHLEKVSGDVLAEYPEAIKEMIRGQSGVYALYRRGHLYYVGLASNLMGRLKQHQRDRHNGRWDRFSVYLTAKDEYMKELESLLLRIIDPKGNIQRGKFASSENLQPALKQRIRGIQDESLHSILGPGTKRKARKRASHRTPAQQRGSQAVPAWNKAAATKRQAGPLHGRFKRSKVLRGTNSGKTYTAKLNRSGTFTFGGSKFETPSGAGKAALGRSVNGWTFWHFRDANGEWVPIGDLRKTEEMS